MTTNPFQTNPFNDEYDSNENQNNAASTYTGTVPVNPGGNRSQQQQQQQQQVSSLLPSPPNSPPPPPPAPVSPPVPFQSVPTVARLESSPRRTATNEADKEKGGRRQQQRRNSKHDNGNSTNTDNTVGEGKKKRKKGKRRQKSPSTNTKPPRGAYGRQYSSTGNANDRSTTTSYSDDAGAPRIVNYPSPKKSSLFSSFLPGNKSNDHDAANDVIPPASKAKYSSTTTTTTTDHGTDDDSSILPGSWIPSLRPNIGQLNSAGGEGTTTPQLLLRIRILHVVHILLIYFIVGNSLFLQSLSLQIERIGLEVALVVLATLLGCFEVTRGTPTLTNNYHHIDNNISNSNSGNSNNNRNRFGTTTSNLLDNSKAAGEAMMYRVIVNGPRRQRIRQFLRKYVCVLYYCIGRGSYLCVMSGLAWVSDTLLMRLLSVSLGLLGLWTILLRYFYPGLDRVCGEEWDFASETDAEYGDVDSSILTSLGSVVTWSSVVGPVGNKSEGQYLIA